MVSAWDIYAEQLFTLGYGHPLWVPEPCVESGEICIGDVGYLRAGGFRFIFSSMKEQDHPRNTRIGVPQGFQPFRPPGHQLVRRPNEIMQGQLHSANLRSTSLSGGVSVDAPATSGNAILRYHCSDSSGAILLLKRAGHYELLDCRLHIKTYMLEHISRWHEFANGDLGIGLQEKEILFVSGFIKTTEWAAAAFRSGGSNGELSISGGFLPLASVSGEFSVSMTRCDSPAVFYRSGPTRSETERLTSEDVAASDQCIFLHYYKMKSRIIWPTIRAAAGPHNLPPGSEDPEHDIIDNLGLEDIESTHDNPDKFDPVGCLLDYILEV
ncbi:hypothetical protein BD309DRAFT_42643 [Dichomitus squalens]|uniref:Uncharacterized protein n=1 Tax=Dichomitus squalens TaxID=114155 RepID=A0A4Q9QD25_9APHY|nr:hypothetical protein BD309DRAFT_42643 [Dichomitus squalens]TBU65220.1 hypothetical protein BD310DRAFT_306794 [Dichomitus squalens]